jgi:ParB family chromosome partitioning protein
MKGGLGRGLSSLIPAKKADASSSAPVALRSGMPAGAVEAVPPGERILHVSVSDIVPNPYQPRRDFRPEELEELIASVKEYGILQPLVVTEKANGMYELIAGERRLRAAKEAGLKKVPVLTRTADDQRKLELALIENIQRADLSAIEEAHAYLKLMDEFGLTQEKVAERVGKSRPVVANTLRLLKLPVEMQLALSDGRISMSMARVLCGMDVPSEQRAMFERMLSGEYTVRQAEDVSRARKASAGRVRASVRDVNLMALESDLREALGTKVIIQKKGDVGQIRIDFYSGEELDELIRKLKR